MDPWKTIAVACALGFGLACDRDPPTLEEADAPADLGPSTGGTLVVAYRGDVEGFDPVTARTGATVELLEQMFPSLARASFDDCRLSFQPGLAESWVWSGEGQTLTLTLRGDRTWQDGRAVGVDDVIGTLARVADPGEGSPRGAGLSTLRDDPPWRRKGDHQLELRYAEAGIPEELLAHVFATPIAPAHAPPSLDGAGTQGAEGLVAAGPFLLDRWEPGHRIRLARREGGGAGETPYLDAVEVRILPDSATRMLAYQRGDVDMLVGVEARELATLCEHRPGTQVFRRGRRFLDFVGWNLQRAPFDDLRVRRAMAHAVDVDLLIDALLVAGEHRLGQRAVGTISPELCHATDPGLEPLARDLALARQLLEEAGWSDTDGDGRLDKGGARLEFTLLYAAGNDRREGVATILQQQLAEVGVEVALQPLERLALYEKLRRGEFDAALSGWSMGLRIDPAKFWSKGGPYNFVGYSDPEINELIERGEASLDPASADQAWRELQRQLYADQPYLFLYWIDEVVVLAPRIRDASVTPVAVFEDLHRWWIPPDLRRHRVP